MFVKTVTSSKFFAADLIKAGPPISMYSINFSNLIFSKIFF